MVPRLTALIVMLMIVPGGPAGAAVLGDDTPPTTASGPSGFRPGPPLWQPSELRPKVAASTIEEAVDRCVADAMGSADTPGASAAVIIDGELAYEQGYGVTRRVDGHSVTPGTQFRIGSVTKMLTAAAVMQLVDAGMLSLHDRLSDLVPEVTFRGHWPAEEITIHRLLTHATGIPDLVFNAAGETGPGALEQWAESLSDVGLQAPPGAFWNYSNPNFNLAGLVVQRASGIDYLGYMEDRVFVAAGMTDTTFNPAAVVARGDYAWGHFDNGDGEIVYPPDGYDNHEFAPAGYAFSTARDLVRWALLLSDGGADVLTPASAAAIQQRHQSLETLPGLDYGYGVFVEPFYDLEIRQHGGNIWGWGAFLLWQPERRFAVAVLANTFESLPGAAYCIADWVLEPNHAVVHDCDVDLRRIEMFEGTYDASVGTSTSPIPYPIKAEVFAAGEGTWFAHLWDPVGPWSALWTLDPVGCDTFIVDVDSDGAYDADLSFLTSAGPPEQTRWLRMRQIVGTPEVDPRVSSRTDP